MSVFAKVSNGVSNGARRNFGQAPLSYADFTCVRPTARTGNYTFPCGVTATSRAAVDALYTAVAALAAARGVTLSMPARTSITTSTAGSIAALLNLFTGQAGVDEWSIRLSGGGTDWILDMPALTAFLNQLAASIQVPAQAQYVLTPQGCPQGYTMNAQGACVFQMSFAPGTTAPGAAAAIYDRFSPCPAGQKHDDAGNCIPLSFSPQPSPTPMACSDHYSYDAASGGCVYTTVATPPTDKGGGGEQIIQPVPGSGAGPGTTVALSPLANALMNMTPDQFAQQWQQNMGGLSSDLQLQVIAGMTAVINGLPTPPGLTPAMLGAYAQFAQQLAQALQQIPQAMALADLAAARATVSTFPWIYVGIGAAVLLVGGGVAWWLLSDRKQLAA